jgi:hypothetical protein
VSGVVNLNKARKKKLRIEKDKRAAANRAKFGRTKAEKASDKSEREILARHIERHKLNDD